MNVERIRKRLQGGFRPFAVVTSGGDKYPVPHPEFIFLTPRTVVIADHLGDVYTLDPLHITALEDLRPQSNSKSGRSRKK